MKRACFVSLILYLTTTFLFAQLQLPSSGFKAAENIVRPLAQQMARPPHPGMFYKSPVMRRLWEGKHQQRLTRTTKPQRILASPFLTTPPMYAAGSNPRDLALGDFNSDGNNDVIVAANPPVVLLGKGDGTLQAAVPIGTIASAPTGVTVADFNRDGKLDVVFAISGGAVVYLGNGDGTFGAGITVSSSGTNQNVLARVLAADVNNDGIADLILNTDAGVSVLLGNGDGTFQTPIFTSWSGVVGGVWSMAAADFNKDGRLDLAVTDGYTTLAIMLGNGAGTFAVSGTYSVAETTNLNSIAVADYNQDRLLDVALPNGQVFLGNGDGTLRAPSTFSTSQDASVVAAADVNGDGIADLLTVNGASIPGCGTIDFGTTGEFLGNGDGTFQPVTLFDSGGCYQYSSAVAIGDLNNDGSPDVVVLSGSNYADPRSSPEVSVLINKGKGTFPAAELNISGGSGGVAVDDFNHDGNADVVLSDGSVYLGYGDGTLRFKGSASLGGVAVATGDFDHDGNPDLAAAVECAPADCSSGGQLLIAAGNGDGTFQIPTALPSGGFYAEALVVADFNDDGNLDIALVNNCTDNGCSTGGSVSIYLGNGTGTLTLLNTIGTITGFPTSVVAGDFNNDGIIDLAVVSDDGFFTSSPVNILIGNGDGSFQPPIVTYTPDQFGITAATVGDLNKDGILDLVLTNGGCSDCGSRGRIMYGNGNGTLRVGPSIGTEGSPQISAVVADFYGTGTLTPVLANTCGDILDCPGGSVMIGLSGTVDQTDIMLLFLAVGDFNNDGKPDLVGSLQYDAGASVLLNIGATAAATTTTISPSAPQSYSPSQPITLTAQVQHTGPETPTGQVQFLDRGVLIGTASVASNGQASLTMAELAVGSHFVVAYYQGDSNFARSNSLGVHVAVTFPTTTTLLSSINPSVSGKQVTFTAAVSSSAGTPTGKVQLLDGATVLAMRMLTSGSVKFTAWKLPPGANSITAVYEGDSNHSGSTSAPVNQIVLAVTTTTLSSSLNPSTYGGAVTFTAVVTPAPPDGETVTFSEGSTVLGTGSLSGGSASFTTSALPAGRSTITAVYGGDSNLDGSTSKDVYQVIKKATTTTMLLSSVNPSIVGKPVTLTVLVSSPAGTPTGKVEYLDGMTVLATLNLTSGSAKYTTTNLPLGSNRVTAVYEGDGSNFASSKSNTVKQVVQ